MLLVRGSLFTLCAGLGALSVASALQVWDGVLAAGRVGALEARLEALGGAHYCFERRERPSSRCIVEKTLDALLSSMGDASPFCEFWSRPDWINLGAHRDVDEARAARSDGDVVTPINGHVLYVDIGAEVRGPTCLFFEDEAQSKICQLVTVPAKSHRLLRFKGDVIHAVPRPALAYLDPEEGGSNLEIFSRLRDEATMHPERKRRTILFNTWQTRPEGVGEVGSAGGGQESGEASKPLGDWVNVPILDLGGGGGDEVRLKLGCLGERKRRVRPQRDQNYLDIFAHRDVKLMLLAHDAVHRVAAREG